MKWRDIGEDDVREAVSVTFIQEVDNVARRGHYAYEIDYKKF